MIVCSWKYLCVCMFYLCVFVEMYMSVFRAICVVCMYRRDLCVCVFVCSGKDMGSRY